MATFALVFPPFVVRMSPLRYVSAPLFIVVRPGLTTVMQSFQVEGPQNMEISLFLRNKIGRLFTGTFQGAS